MAASHDAQAETTVLTVEGDIDTAVFRQFFGECAVAIAGPGAVLQLHLAGVTFVDSMASMCCCVCRMRHAGPRKGWFCSIHQSRCGDC